MLRKLLLTILVIVLCAAVIYKSPLAATYNYNKAKTLIDQGKYEQSLTYFEKSLFASPNNSLSRFFYAMALSKSQPTYSVQKKIYEIADSQVNDQAKSFAKSQLINLRYKLLHGLANNYIYNAVQTKDVIRWDIRKFPLKVYIGKNTNDVPEYYKEAILSAMNQWQEKTNFIKFQLTDNPAEANILISFQDNNNECGFDGCKYVVANTTPKITNNTLEAMELSFYKTNPYKKIFSRQEIYTTALHELGHTLGIMGHSDNPADIMYSAQEKNGRAYSIFGNQRLSGRDINTIVLLYRLSPTISNTKNLHSESFYYVPLILGDSTAQAERKIQELKQYISKYPEIANGYINLGATYADIGDYQNALQNLIYAERLAQTEEERFLIAYNRAMIYFNTQDLTKSYEYAVQAQSIKNDSGITELINEIQKIKTP